MTIKLPLIPPHIAVKIIHQQQQILVHTISSMCVIE